MKPNTKAVIQESFRQLLGKRPLDKITVRDIVEDCDLSRNTFYYHYTDIYDLFDDYLDCQMQQAIREAHPEEAWEETLARLLARIFDSPRTGRNIFFSKKQDTLRLYFSRLLEVVIDQYLQESAQGLMVSPQDRRLICDACCFSLYGLLEQWLTGPEAPLLQENLRRLSRCFDGTLRHALRYCAQNPRGKEPSHEA